MHKDLQHSLTCAPVTRHGEGASRRAFRLAVAFKNETSHGGSKEGEHRGGNGRRGGQGEAQVSSKVGLQHKEAAFSSRSHTSREISAKCHRHTSNNGCLTQLENMDHGLQPQCLIQRNKRHRASLEHVVRRPGVVVVEFQQGIILKKS